MNERQPIRRALVSVYDKRGLDRLAAALAEAGVEVVSTGSTAAALAGHGLAVTPVEFAPRAGCFDGAIFCTRGTFHVLA